MSDINELKEKLGSAVKKAGENLKELDMGVAYSKMEDVISSKDDNKGYIITYAIIQPYIIINSLGPFLLNAAS